MTERPTQSGQVDSFAAEGLASLQLWSGDGTSMLVLAPRFEPLVSFGRSGRGNVGHQVGEPPRSECRAALLPPLAPISAARTLPRLRSGPVPSGVGRQSGVLP